MFSKFKYTVHESLSLEEVIKGNFFKILRYSHVSYEVKRPCINVVTFNSLFTPIINLTWKNQQKFTTNYYLSSRDWHIFWMRSSLEIPIKYFHIVDGLQYRVVNDYPVIVYYANNMLTDSRVSVSTELTTVNKLVSLSWLFSSTVWLERELSDFSNITFIQLRDTRRLLLDYLEPKQVWATHIQMDKNYNNTFYDVFLTL